MSLTGPELVGAPHTEARIHRCGPKGPWSRRKGAFRSQPEGLAYRTKELSLYARGWVNYFGISDYYRPIPEIDSWIRRRIRMCYWEQWRYVRTKLRYLHALGTSKRHAIMTALSSKS